jgi:hypothetical protein
MATVDKVCPTLDLPYATPVNLVVNASNMPTDINGVVIDRNNPTGIPRYTDTDGDGDSFDDSFLRDTRLQPCRGTTCNNPGNGVTVTRYSVVVPTNTVGPIAVTSAVYYQAFEGIVAKKFLGNLADTDDDAIPMLEPCVLKGPCDRAANNTEYRNALKFDPVAVEERPYADGSAKRRDQGDDDGYCRPGYQQLQTASEE